MKTCSMCKKDKNLSEYAFQNKALGKTMSACKICSNSRQKAFRKNNPELQKLRDKKSYFDNREKRIAYAKAYRDSNPERQRDINYKTKYGISLEEYNGMKYTQKGCCKICGEHESSLKRVLCVDHCHTTGEVRGLLCDTCNKFLGFYEKLHKECKEYLNDY